MTITARTVEFEVVPGLENFALGEIFEQIPKFRVVQQGSGFIRGSYPGPLATVSRLRTVQAVYTVHTFSVPRPKALLGDQAFRLLIAQIEDVRAANTGKFATLYVAAAGSESTVMNRLKQVIAERTGLLPADDKGDLMLRIMPAREGIGWETLVRTTSRPLATRWWRLHNFDGALNATVAAAMNRLTEPGIRDRYLNLACGSATLAIERALSGQATVNIGLDHNPEAIETAAVHRLAAGRKVDELHFVHADLNALPFASGAFNALTADLPFGQRVGSHRDNVRLYPAALREAARVTCVGGRLIVITHEIRLMAEVIGHQSDWSLDGEWMITLRGLHPRIYALSRR